LFFYGNQNQRMDKSFLKSFKVFFHSGPSSYLAGSSHVRTPAFFCHRCVGVGVVVAARLTEHENGDPLLLLFRKREGGREQCRRSIRLCFAFFLSSILKESEFRRCLFKKKEEEKKN
jgi:hypothetical protein